jgi:hypothetical protein
MFISPHGDSRCYTREESRFTISEDYIVNVLIAETTVAQAIVELRAS